MSFPPLLLDAPAPGYGQAPLLRNSARGKPVLYLDFDGVLHPNEVYVTKQGIVLRAPGHQLFESMSLLEEALRPYPDVRIVLSTSWATERGFTFARSKLSASLQARTLGATFHRRFMRKAEFEQASRGMQVYSDTLRRGAGSWLALDDDTHDWPAWCRDQLVACPPDAGLADRTTLELFQTKLAAIA